MRGGRTQRGLPGDASTVKKQRQNSTCQTIIAITGQPNHQPPKVCAKSNFASSRPPRKASIWLATSTSGRPTACPCAKNLPVNGGRACRSRSDRINTVSSWTAFGWTTRPPAVTRTILSVHAIAKFWCSERRSATARISMLPESAMKEVNHFERNISRTGVSHL